MASLSEEELNKVIDKAIEDYKIKEEERKRREEEAKEEQEFEERNATMDNAFGGLPGGGLGGRPGGPPTLGGGNGKWYFYNPQVVSMGQMDFEKNWGKRRLEDNWRISDKRQMMSGGDFAQTENITKGEGTDSARIARKALTPLDRAYYLKEIPKTKEDFRISDSLMVEAYNKLGFIYAEKLRDTANAIAVYEEFLSKFPTNKYELEAWYALYKLYTSNNEPDKADKYKNLILTKYPKSDYAKVITDPEYFINLAKKKGAINKLYERAYKAFEKEQYFRVLLYSNRALKEFAEDTVVIPKFLYLRALSLGQAATPDTMYVELKKLVHKYPNNEIVPQAYEIMKYLRKEYGFDGGEKESDKPAKKYKYKVNDNSPHFVALVVNNKNVKVNPLKVRISDFDKKYFRLKKLRIRSLIFDKTNTIITIGNFANKKEADKYYNALSSDQYVLSGIDKNDIKVFPISSKNYPIMYKDKDLKGYLEFLKDVYDFE